jgi:hypothetical protein
MQGCPRHLSSMVYLMICGAAVRELQQQVVHDLGDLLDRQREQLKVEEASALRQFRSRLLTMEAALEAERRSQTDQQTPLLRQMVGPSTLPLGHAPDW